MLSHGVFLRRPSCKTARKGWSSFRKNAPFLFSTPIGTRPAAIEAWWAQFTEKPTHPKDALTIADDIRLPIRGETDRARAQSLGVLLGKWKDKTYDLEDGTRVTFEVMPEDAKGSRYRLLKTVKPAQKERAIPAITAIGATDQKCPKHPVTPRRDTCETCRAVYLDPDDPTSDLEATTA
jgi:hypothetical protein